MCVCVFSSHVLATVPLVKARRVLHFCSVSRGLHLFRAPYSVYFSVQLEPTEVTQEGVNTGAFFFFLCIFFCAPPSPCGACLHFYREKGSAVPSPRRP